MKKIIMTFLLQCMILSSLSVCAQGAVVSVGQASGYMGDIVEIPVILSSNAGFISLGIEIDYDNKALELVEVIDNGLVGGSFGSAKELSKKPYNMSWYSASDITFNGELAILKFKLLAESGEYAVSVNFYKGIDGNYTDGDDVNFDEDFDNLNLTYKSGKILIKEKDGLIISNIETLNKTEFTVSVTGNIKGNLIAAIYDQASGVMKQAKTVPAESENHFSFNYTEGIIKVFWLNNGLSPVVEHIIKRI